MQDSLSSIVLYIIAFSHCDLPRENLKTDWSDQPFFLVKSDKKLHRFTGLYSVVGNDLSEPDTFILQGQREVHEENTKKEILPTSNMNETLVRQRCTLSSVQPAEILKW